MREYRIYYDGKGANSLSFEDFAKGIEEEINANDEILEQARKCNTDFSAKVMSVLANPENSTRAGALVDGIIAKTPRYVFLKNRELRGKKYEVEIDLLTRRFSIIEV